MISNIKESFILKLFFIVFAISSTNNTTKNGTLVFAEVLIEPLWSHNTSQCYVDRQTSGRILFHGSMIETCSLQVTAPPETRIQLQIPGRNTSQEPSFLYIEHDGDLENCDNKYVVFNEQIDICSSIVNHKNIQVNLQGKVSLVIRDVPTMDILSKCPKEGVSTTENVSQLSNCSGLKIYNESISCDPQDVHMCRIKFPSNCGAVLGHREVTYEKCKYNLSLKHTAVVIYPLHTMILDLSNNKIIKIRARSFSGLQNVHKLNLSRNSLSKLNVDAFWGLTNLTCLDLNSNRIAQLNARLFLHLRELKHLSMSYNILTTLPKLQGLLNLERLCFSGNQIASVSTGELEGLDKIKELRLRDNLLSTLPEGLFLDAVNLETLHLDGNNITNLNAGVFLGLSKLKDMRLNDNVLSTLPCDLFRNLVNLKTLVIDRNNIANLPVSVFTGLRKLQYLFIAMNKLVRLDTNLFHDLTSLKVISLDNNKLVNLPKDIFKGLAQLIYIILSNNYLTQLDNILKGLTNLHAVTVFNNRLTRVDDNIFKDTFKLGYLDMAGNRLNTIPSIEHLGRLTNFDISNSTLLWISEASFSSLPRHSHVLASQHEVCECYVPSYVNCSAADKRSPYLTCDRLLSDRSLVVVMWLIGLGALSGNLFVVLVWRKKGTHTHIVNSILLKNLATSDLLMGIYMLIIASADIYFGDNFPMQSETWRSGVTCRIAGAISIISSEASVFFITLMSIDRFIAIRFPYSLRKLRKRSATLVAVATWTISFVIGTVPSALSGVSLKFYDNSHVCIGLPLALTKLHINNYTTKTYVVPFEQISVSYEKNIFAAQYKGLTHGLFFSAAIFLGLNSICLMVIICCYVEIVRAFKKSSIRSGRSQEMKEQIRLTTKVTAIVATDFCCWFPTILLGVLVQTRVIELPISVYAWCVTFVLPINSAINPYLYTIADIVLNKTKNKQDKNKTNTFTFKLTSSQKIII